MPIGGGSAVFGRSAPSSFGPRRWIGSGGGSAPVRSRLAPGLGEAKEDAEGDEGADGEEDRLATGRTAHGEAGSHGPHDDEGDPVEEVERIAWAGTGREPGEADEAVEPGEADPGEIPDDRLRLIFTCCHPALSLEAQVALALRTLGGLTTAEIARAQLWQWRYHRASLADGRPVTAEFYRQVRDEEVGKLGGRSAGRLAEAIEILDRLVLDDEFTEFLTFLAYDYID